ncbi:hypothetical protein QBC45DRAFT_464456 [Copromyces sp. CBS 386.78]|nr:hypothetical protein QBC45DRAFT_464456 [Copromyces sp. CBS 386.78]
MQDSNPCVQNRLSNVSCSHGNVELVSLGIDSHLMRQCPVSAKAADLPCLVCLRPGEATASSCVAAPGLERVISTLRVFGGLTLAPSLADPMFPGPEEGVVRHAEVVVSAGGAVAERVEEPSVRPLCPEAEAPVNACRREVVPLLCLPLQVVSSWRRRPRHCCCGCPPRRQLEQNGSQFCGTDDVIDDAWDVVIDDVDVESRWQDMTARRSATAMDRLCGSMTCVAVVVSMRALKPKREKQKTEVLHLEEHETDRAIDTGNHKLGGNDQHSCFKVPRGGET